MLVKPLAWCRYAGRWLVTRFTGTKSLPPERAECSAGTSETPKTIGMADSMPITAMVWLVSTTDCPICKQPWVLHSLKDSMFCSELDLRMQRVIATYFQAGE